MPTVSVKKDLLFKALGKKYSDEEFAELCFAFGLELDEITSERQILKKETGADPGKDASNEVLFRIDVPANRYDLLCLEGLAQAILVFQGRIKPPKYVATAAVEKLTIQADTAKIRAYCVAAILRGVTFTPDSYASWIDLQDKLHQNLCRKRSLVAIGTHDLDTVKGPFTYNALPPSDIKFKPLNQTKEYTGEGIMELYKNHAQLKQYLSIIKDSTVYPVILDSNGVVLSLPPVINGDHSKITLNTTNIFIECTATDKHKATVVLDTLVCMFAQYCSPKYHVEQVVVVSSNGKKTKTPSLTTRSLTVDCDRMTRIAGVDLPETEKVANLLERMGLSSVPKLKKESPKLDVLVPPTRHDVLHERDVVEDLAIAYGYNNIQKVVPATSTVGKELPLNKLSDLVREEVARCGFTEALTFSLCSEDDVAKKLGRKIEDVKAVHVANPKTLEFQVARTALLPCLLKTLSSNKKMPVPLKIFEVSDVVFAETSAEVGARNERHVGAVILGRTSGFEVIHGLLDRIMQSLKVENYCLRASEDSAFFSSRHAQILVDGKVLGSVGVLHPNVIKDFELTMPCSALELNLEPFL